ncbi:hypothetical protein [Pseudomonas sp. M47T1]|uniref:hypothetical protein n=1 Tax=Pseudomonas sp. M47T1 TaxID=1179778 RepID=UPI0003123D0D|nr:hypothetical protein [Pseudomonas sp. M47T1]
MSLLTSWLAFTSENGLPDLYCRFNVDAWGTPVAVTGKAWLTTGASELLISLNWAF